MAYFRFLLHDTLLADFVLKERPDSSKHLKILEFIVCRGLKLVHYPLGSMVSSLS